MSKKSADAVAIKIVPNVTGNPAGKLVDAEVTFEADDSRPFSGMTFCRL